MPAVHEPLHNSATGSRFPKARRAWGWILAYAILLIVIGAVAMFNPVGTNMAIGVLFGLMLGIAGVAAIIAGFRDFGWQSKLVDFLFGALALVGAFIFLAMPVLSAASLVWAAGIFFIVNGVVELYHGFKADEDRIYLLAMGAIDLLLGLYIAFLMPVGAQILALAWIVGLGFIFRGLLLAFVAFKVRGLTKRLSGG